MPLNRQQQTANNKQQTTNNKQQTTNNKQQTTSTSTSTSTATSTPDAVNNGFLAPIFGSHTLLVLVQQPCFLLLYHHVTFTICQERRISSCVNLVIEKNGKL
jgi:hypothetical protein